MEDEGDLHRKLLLDLYWNQEKSLNQISKELDIPLRTLAMMFDKYGIRTRSIKKAMRVWWKHHK